MRRMSMLALVIMMLLAGCTSPQDVDHQVVNPEAFEAALDNSTGAFLLDVRTTDEWEDGHLEGSILIPHLELEARVDELPSDLSQTIHVYCQSGSRSARAIQTLIDLGYRSIIELDGGIGAWTSSGRPVVR